MAVMSTWSDGYVTDIAYEWYFFHELAPAHLDFACQLRGHTPPGRGAGFNYLELGSGLGLTSTLLAATNPGGRFWGVDVNPTHVVSAEALAEEAGVGNVTFIEAAFDELPRHELPAFDYIVLHGVWSWVSAATRASILDVLRTRLKPGGVVYVSYNCAAGWGQVQSYGHLLRTVARLEHGTVEQRVRAALERLRALARQPGGFFEARPAAKVWLEQLGNYSANYVAHEYLTEHWAAFHFDDVLHELEPAKLSFAGAANVLRNFDYYALKTESRRLADSLGDLELLETLKDLDTNAGLRKDIFIRGSQASTPEQTLTTLKDARFALVVEEVPGDELQTSLGETQIAPEVLGPFVAALRERPQSLQELAALVTDVPGYELVDMLVVCAVLVDGRYIAPLPCRATDGAQESSAALNRAIVRRTLAGNPIRFLAAPAIGSGITCGDWERYCYAMLESEGELDAETLHRRVADALSEQQRVLQDAAGTALDDEQLGELARRFTGATLERWNALGVM